MSGIRDLFPSELKILQTIDAYVPTEEDKRKGRPLHCSVESIEEACHPHPIYEDMSFLIQQHIIDNPKTSLGNDLKPYMELLPMGQSMLADYTSGKRKVQAQPRIPTIDELNAAKVPGPRFAPDERPSASVPSAEALASSERRRPK